MAHRRRPANRKGPRSAKHRQFTSPHQLSPRSLCHSPVSSGDEMTDQEAQETAREEPTTPPRDAPEDVQPAVEQESSGDEAVAAAAEAIEAVVLKLEAAAETSDASTASLDGEVMLKHGSMPPIREEQEQQQEGEPVAQELRRSRRKRRTVEVLSPSNVRKSPHKRRAAETKRMKVEELVNARPAAAAAAAVRAAAAAKEKKRKQAPKQKKIARGKGRGEKTPNGVLSPMQDEKKKTPQKKRSRKARRSLEPAFSYDSQTEYVSQLIADLYEEQEQDDRGMYNITRDTVVAETSSCEQSQEVKELSMEDFRRLMTYGEVSVESVASTILPFLNLDEEDVFFDLGCGTGKILVQAALQTPCKRAIGIELMQNRVEEGAKALERLEKRDIPVLRGKQIEVIQGDICAPPERARLMDATVVFINNVMFGPTLMLKVLALLKDMSKLRCVVTLRKICERHGDMKCQRSGNYCVEYVHPPPEAEIDVSWADKTSVYQYISVEYNLGMLRRRLAAIQQGEERRHARSTTA